MVLAESAPADAGRPPTLETVAALAGVSRATASRVVNNLDRVAPHVVASVNAAIDELGYVPNQAARSLARRRTAVVAVVIPESTERLFADPFFATVVQGVAAHLSATDYTLSLVLGSNEGDKSRRYLTGGNVDGVLVVSQHEGDLPADPARADRADRLRRSTRRGLRRARPLRRRRQPSGGGERRPAPPRSGADPDRHHRRSAGSGRRTGPARWLARRPRPTPICRMTWWRWGTSPRSPARRRWRGCSPARCSTRCSRPTTRWPSVRSRP